MGASFRACAILVGMTLAIMRVCIANTLYEKAAKD